MDMATRLNPGSPPVRTRKYRHLSSSRQLGLTCWKTSNKGPGYPNKNFLPVFRVSCRQPWTGTRRMVASRIHRPSVWTAQKREYQVSIIWTIIIGFVVGVIAKFIMPGNNEPSGFVLTAVLGIVGAFVATYLGQVLGWYGPNEGAGLIASVIGAVIVLAVWSMIDRRRTTTL